jgi:myo-inositol 2-dehydrogenase/D-chiro-inositol 1-dehydrogenase
VVPVRVAPAGLVDVAEALRTHRLAWAVAEATRTGSTVRVGAR